MNSPVITVALLALCSWLGWMAYEETGRPVPNVHRLEPAAGATTTKTQPKSEQQDPSVVFPSLESLDDFVARPLFHETRRPIKIEEPEPVAVAPTDLNVMLSGIVIGQTQQIAHLRSLSDKQTLALKVGEKIGDWEIKAIFPDHVVLRSGGRIETLFMQKPGATGPSAAPSTQAVQENKSEPARIVSSPPRRTGSTPPKRNPRRNLQRLKRRGE